MTTVQQPTTAPALMPVPPTAPTAPAPAAPPSTMPSWMAPAVLAVALVLLLLTAVVAAVVVHIWPGALVPVNVIGTVCGTAGSLATVAALARRP
ncbi:hypothetical protein OG599_35065 (plasmid) [Streptomyces sp. NBC_01335]|uniref:hypothetical protein n=1 Tax=Streptomyces sp. NBC_01335 TaxID=2903828 RepID=UPI002E11E3F1|nr:hypothetical protein OG599_35065 [Streptomyces sp. NBC_01335]